MLALANTVENCIANCDSQQAFVGKITLPFFCQGIPDFSQPKMDQNQKQVADALPDILTDLISKKQVVCQKGFDALIIN